MNKIPLTNIFIYEFSIDENIVDNALAHFLSYQNFKALSSNRSGPNESLGIYPTDKNNNVIGIYEEKIFGEIQKYVDEVTRIHFTDNINLSICDSWLTKTTMGQRCEYHLHQFSILSGLVYLTDHKKSETYFTLDDPFYENHKTIFGPIIKKQENVVKIQPKKGKLIIWDSTIPHKLSTHTDTTTRYTLAFNTFFTGSIHNQPSMRLSLDCKDVSQQSNNT